MIEIICALVTLALTYNLFKNLQKSNGLLHHSGAHHLGAETTLAVPVRNEIDNLRDLVPRLIDQRSRPKELLFLDDQSSDGSAAFLREYATRYPFIRVVKGQPLPPQWKGKVWALHQLQAEVRTRYVAFIDCDVRPVCSTALGSLFRTIDERQAVNGFTSVFPQPRVGFGASLLVHQIHTYLYYFLPHAPDKLPRGGESAVAGCGQLMFMPLSRLRLMNGYENLKNSTHDGLMMARLFRKNQNEVLALEGGAAFESETYKNFAAAFRGFSRNSFEATNSVGATLFISLITWLVFVMPFIEFRKMLHHPLWFVAWAAMMAGQFQVARRFNFTFAHVLLTPVKALLSIAVHLWGMVKAKLKLSGTWRGRSVVS